jgi:multiple sugar transport system permease protein
MKTRALESESALKQAIEVKMKPTSTVWQYRYRDVLDRYDRYLLPAPAVLVVVAMLIFPVAFTVYLSFHEWSAGIQAPTFVGLENYRDMAMDRRFWQGVVRTVYFVVMSVGSQIVLGLIAALVFHRQFFGRGVARTIFLLPMMATPAAIALVWKMMFDPTIGILGYLLKIFRLPQILWTADSRTVLPSLALVDTWQWTPLVMIIILAGLAALPVEPYEAAKVDGASSLQAFVYLTLPLLRPALVVAAMFRVIDAIKTFDIIMVITGGGPSYASEILNIQAFSEALSYFHFGYGSALLVALSIIVVAVALFFSRIRRGGYYT